MSVVNDLSLASVKLHQALLAVKGHQGCWCPANSTDWQSERHTDGCKRAIAAVAEFERTCSG